MLCHNICWNSSGVMEDITYDTVHIPEEEHQYNIMAPNSDPHYNATVHSGKPEVSFAGNPPSYGVLSGKPHAAEKATKSSGTSQNWRFVICLSIVLVVVLVCVCVSLAVAVWSAVEVRKVSSSAPNSVQEGVTAVAIDSLQGQLDSLLSQLDSLQDSNSAIYSQLNEILSGQLPSIPASSCMQVSLVNSSPPSGYYWVRASNGSAVRVYCDMTRSCGGVTRGWTRVAYLQFENGSDPCPSGFRERNDSGIRTCGNSSTTATCPSILFDTYGIPYSKVCGKVLAYQDSSTNAFANYHREMNLTIDSNYVDGVSLTHGSNPRQHIWTFAAALDEFDIFNNGAAACPCSHTRFREVSLSPTFVGQDYFCDSGVQGIIRSRGFKDDPLWDGAGCGPTSICCSFNNPP